MFSVVLVVFEVELQMVINCVDVSDGGVVEFVIIWSLWSWGVGIVVCVLLFSASNCIFDIDCGKLTDNTVDGSGLIKLIME